MVLSYLGITRLKSVLEDAQNLQVQLILLTCRVSSGSLLSIDTFCSMILLVDSEGPDQITQLWSGPSLYAHARRHIFTWRSWFKY